MFNNKIKRRLLPLYLASFSQGLIFWFAIEKVFMTDIGFTAASIAVVAIVLNLTGLFLEIPFGVLADRWSRKGVLILSSIALAAASLLLGLSDSVLEYTFVSILFGMHFALNSGTYDSIVYDTLLEENGTRDGYEKYYGYVTVCASLGMVISSLLGGIAADSFGLQSAYFLSVPGGIIAILCLLFFREPQLHKTSTDNHIISHMKDTLKIIFQKGNFAILLITIVLISLVLEFMLEVDQLWPLALALPVVLYGPLNALLLFAYGLAAPLASKLVKNRMLLMLSCLSLIVFTFMLTIANMPIITIAQFGLTATTSALVTLLSGRLHDSLPSRLRSGGSSTVSTLRTLTFIPLVFIFGLITTEYSVFTAAYLIIPLSLMGVIGLLKLPRQSVLQ
jgi:MFS family permease